MFGVGWRLRDTPHDPGLCRLILVPRSLYVVSGSLDIGSVRLHGIDDVLCVRTGDSVQRYAWAAACVHDCQIIRLSYVSK